MAALSIVNIVSAQVIYFEYWIFLGHEPCVVSVEELIIFKQISIFSVNNDFANRNIKGYLNSSQRFKTSVSGLFPLLT